MGFSGGGQRRPGRRRSKRGREAPIEAVAALEWKLRAAVAPVVLRFRGVLGLWRTLPTRINGELRGCRKQLRGSHIQCVAHCPEAIDPDGMVPVLDSRNVDLAAADGLS